MKLHLRFRRKTRRSGQQGYVLIVMLLFLTLLAISLTAAAPAMVQSIRRQREIELIHRGGQYVRAIRLYYRKFGRYPTRLEELENTNNIRFLRKRYKDPVTPSGEWRLIHFGEVQFSQAGSVPVLPGATTPGSPGFTGQGPPFATPGSSGFATAGSTSSPFANTFSISQPPGSGQAIPAQSPTGTTPSQPGLTPEQAGTTQPASGDSSQSSQSGQPGGQPGTPASQLGSLGGQTFGGGPVVGVASKSKKESIRELNKKNHYNEWEFVYDPRLDLTTAQQAVAGAAATGQQNPLAPGTLGLGTQTPGTQPSPTSPGMPGISPAK